MLTRIDCARSRLHSTLTRSSFSIARKSTSNRRSFSFWSRCSSSAIVVRPICLSTSTLSNRSTPLLNHNSIRQMTTSSKRKRKSSTGDSAPSASASSDKSVHPSTTSHSGGHSDIVPFPSPTPETSIFLVTDVQENFRGRLFNWQQVVEGSRYMIKCAKLLNIPVLLSEHIPFQPTIKELSSELSMPSPKHNPEADELQHHKLHETNELKLNSSTHHSHNRLFAKTLFSMFTDELRSHLTSKPTYRHLFIFGLEAHVCVLQTVIDAVNAGYAVHVVVDAIGSQCKIDFDCALERLRGMQSSSKQPPQQPVGGIVYLTSAEAAIFEIISDSAHPQFLKGILPIVKEFAKEKKQIKPSESALGR